MEDAVDDCAVQFVVVSCPELLGVAPHCVETDEYVPGDYVALGIVESDDVSVIVVVEVLAIDLDNPVVRAEDVGYFACLLAISPGYTFDPSGRLAPFD